MLADKIILITGSSQGIGRATAQLAKNQGVRVILHDKTESEALKKTAAELGAPYIFCDVADGHAVAKAVENLGRVDVLVNNAGISISKPFLELTDEDWMETFKVNLFGVVNFSKAVIPGMLTRKHGKIINISSVKGYPNTAGRAAFASSKASVITLTASMAKEFAPHILVNGVAPGFTETETTKQVWSERIYQQISKTLLQRPAQPEEIAQTILFLADSASDYITGQTILVDGGYSMSN